MQNFDQWNPNPKDLKGWWERFWSDRQVPFGGPSRNLLPVISAEILSRKGATLSAVDIGSGNGRYAIPMAELGCSVTALEWTKSGADRVQEMSNNKSVHVDIDRVDYTEACLDHREYDLVVCSGLLEEIDSADHINAITGFARWTSRGGLAVIKYCLELEGRGQLVDAGLTESVLRDQGMHIVSVREEKTMKTSAATKMGIRTGTVIARQPG